MKRKYFSIAGAGVCWFAIVAQCYLLLANRTTSVTEALIRFFNYFTILTNILVAICFTVDAAVKNSPVKRFLRRPGILTAMTVYIVIVGVIYQTLLRNLWQPEGLQFIVDELLHGVIPIGFIVYWVLYGKKKTLAWHNIFSWLLYPLLYAGYILYRGRVSGFYPYPFIDASVLGRQKLLINISGMLSLFIIFSILFIGLGRLLPEKDQAADFQRGD